MSDTSTATPVLHCEFIPVTMVETGMRLAAGGTVTKIRTSKSGKSIWFTMRSPRTNEEKEWPRESAACNTAVFAEAEPLSSYEPDGEPYGGYICRNEDGTYDVVLFEETVEINVASFEAALHLLAGAINDPHMAAFIASTLPRGRVDIHYVNRATGMRVQFPVPLEYIRTEPKI